jgi:hypothetical protein
MEFNICIGSDICATCRRRENDEGKQESKKERLPGTGQQYAVHAISMGVQ